MNRNANMWPGEDGVGGGELEVILCVLQVCSVDLPEKYQELVVGKKKTNKEPRENCIHLTSNTI